MSVYCYTDSLLFISLVYYLQTHYIHVYSPTLLGSCNICSPLCLIMNFRKVEWKSDPLHLILSNQRPIVDEELAHRYKGGFSPEDLTEEIWHGTGPLCKVWSFFTHGKKDFLRRRKKKKKEEHGGLKYGPGSLG